ncbi:hypothetical protein ES707_20943 [subsurface metagenome]
MSQRRSTVRTARGMRFGYVKIPAEVEMIPEDILSSQGKRLCGYAGSFGVKGCYQSKATLGRYFGVSRWTMIRLVKRLKELRLIVWMGKTTVPGCMWLRCNPKVQAAEWLVYRGRSIRNPAFTCSKPATSGVAAAQQALVAAALHNNNRTKRTTTAASLSPDEVQARQRKKEEADARRGIQSQLWAKIAERIPLPPTGDKEAMERRSELITAMVHRGEELVAAGVDVDNAAETAFNEAGCAVFEGAT